MLVWARESARFTIEEAAHKGGFSAEKLAACEAGDQHLTFAQLMKMAREYKRPVSLFYLKEPPKGWSPIKDFRLLHGVEQGFSAQLTYVIRQARERRELAIELRKEIGEPIQPFSLSATLKDDVEVTGQKIRKYLGITEAAQVNFKRRAFDSWRTAIEARDVLVFVVPRLALSEMRGAAVDEEELPIILVNGKDQGGGRIFTLLHEFCHLTIGQGGVSGEGGDKEKAPDPAVEVFCNAVAAAALMPSDWLLKEYLVVQKGTTKTWQDDELEALALRFGVSPEAVLRRLLTLGRTTQSFYESRRALFLQQYADLAKDKGEGPPVKYHVQVLSQLGRTFTRLIFQGYHEHALTLRDVSNHFNMQVKLIPAMEKATFGLKG